MYQKKYHFGKEFFIGCVATDISMCFILKDLGTNLAKENNDRPYFTSTNENFWLCEAKEALKESKLYDWSDGEYKEIYKESVGSTMVEVAQALRWASRDGLIKRDKWEKVLKEFFALMKEMFER